MIIYRAKAAVNAFLLGLIIWPITALLIISLSEVAVKEYNDIYFYLLAIPMIPVSFFLVVKSIYDENIEEAKK